jgi:hypothetical protein
MILGAYLITTWRGVFELLAGSPALRQQDYGNCWAVESFFSGLKRTMGAAVNARRADQKIAEASFPLLTYTLHR